MSTSSADRREIIALKSQVRRLEAANQEIEHLRAAFDALVVAHATSKSQRQEIASTLRHELQESRNKASSSQSELKEARRTIHALALCQRSQPSAQKQAADAWTARLDSYENSIQLERAQKRAQEKTDGLELVWAALQDSEQQRQAMAQDLEDSRCDYDDAVAQHQLDRELFKKERKAWAASIRDRSQEVALATQHLKDELRFVKKQHKLSEQFANMNELAMLGQLQSTQDDLQYTQASLHTANQKNNDLKSRLDSTERQLKQEKQDHAATQAKLDDRVKDHQRLTSELERERSDRKADWDAMQERVDKLDLEKQTQTQRAVRAEEKLGKLQKEMVLLHAREQDLQDQVDSANEQLVELDGLRVAHAQLSTQLTELSARNTLAEADSAALSDLNAQLLGHANPHQKIVQVAKIRQELTDIKKKYAMALAGLEAAKMENKELNDELDSLRVAHHPPAAPDSVSPSTPAKHSLFSDALSKSAAGMRIRRPPASVHRVLSDATNTDSRRVSNSSSTGAGTTLTTTDSKDSLAQSSQHTSPATSLGSARVSLAHVASTNKKFKSFLR